MLRLGNWKQVEKLARQKNDRPDHHFYWKLIVVVVFRVIQRWPLFNNCCRECIISRKIIDPNRADKFLSILRVCARRERTVFFVCKRAVMIWLTTNERDPTRWDENKHTKTCKLQVSLCVKCSAMGKRKRKREDKTNISQMKTLDARTKKSKGKVKKRQFILRVNENKPIEKRDGQESWSIDCNRLETKNRPHRKVWTLVHSTYSITQ